MIKAWIEREGRKRGRELERVRTWDGEIEHVSEASRMLWEICPSDVEDWIFLWWGKYIPHWFHWCLRRIYVRRHAGNKWKTTSSTWIDRGWKIQWMSYQRRLGVRTCVMFQLTFSHSISLVRFYMCRLICVRMAQFKLNAGAAHKKTDLDCIPRHRSDFIFTPK